LKENFAKALVDFDRAAALDPKSHVVLLNRGLVRAALEQFDPALVDYDRAAALAPGNAEILSARAFAHHSLEHYERAIADYNEAIRLSPRDYRLHVNLASIWADCPDQKFRDGKRAVESAMKACELTKFEDEACLELLVLACLEAGDIDQAEKWRAKIDAL
jgi:tetratricopeptide (TPR) repeat protein